MFVLGNQIDFYAAKQVLHAKIHIVESSQSLFQRFNRLNNRINTIMNPNGQASPISNPNNRNQVSIGNSSLEHDQIVNLDGGQVVFSEDQYLHVFTTHMQASYNENDSSINILNDRARLGQVGSNSVMFLFICPIRFV